MNIGKHLIAFNVLLEIDFDEMGKQLLPDITDKIRLTYLPGTIDQQNFVGFFREEAFQEWSKLTFKHDQNHLNIGTKLHISYHFTKEKSTYSVFSIPFFATYSVFKKAEIATYSVFSIPFLGTYSDFSACF